MNTKRKAYDDFKNTTDEMRKYVVCLHYHDQKINGNVTILIILLFGNINGEHEQLQRVQVLRVFLRSYSCIWSFYVLLWISPWGYPHQEG